MSNQKLEFIWENLTNKILEKLDEALLATKEGKKVILPWQTPYNACNAPRNPVTKNEYSGSNYLNLIMSQYESPFWLTEKNINDIEGIVKKEELKKYQHIVFWKILNYANKEETGGKTKSVPLMRYTRVYNMEQLESYNTDKLKLPSLAPLDFKPLEKAEEIVEAYFDKPEILVDPTGTPRYNINKDVIYMPAKSQFKQIEGYYATLFHELGHSTGSKNRLNRPGVTNFDKFGSHRYSSEELVAEFLSAFLCGYAGIENNTLDNSVSYIEGWGRIFRQDKHIIMKACSDAQKACQYILKGEEHSKAA